MCCAGVVVSEMAALCVPETDSLSCANLCEECGKELETHCFVHSVEIDEVAVLSFEVFETKLLLARSCL